MNDYFQMDQVLEMCASNVHRKVKSYRNNSYKNKHQLFINWPE